MTLLVTLGLLGVLLGVFLLAAAALLVFLLLRGLAYEPTVSSGPADDTLSQGTPAEEQRRAAGEGR